MLRFPPKRILVPFDFSEVSLAAWRQAQLLSRRFGARVEALYVEEWVPTGELFQPWRLTPRRRAQMRDRVRSKIGRLARVHVLEGSPVVMILRLVRTRRVDLIVMGTTGRRGIDRFWRGSTTESVTRLSPVPILAVRGRARPIRSILAPVNFTDYSDLGFFYAAEMAAALKAPLTALHVTADPLRCGNPRFLTCNLIERLPPSTLRHFRPEVRVRRGIPHEEIVVESSRHGVVVLSAHRKSLFSLGTTAERVIQGADVAVLTVPAPKAPVKAGQWGLGAAVGARA